MNQKNLITLLQQMEVAIVEPLANEEYEVDHWPYYPFGIQKFIGLLKEARTILGKNKKNKKFIDVGCGIGTKVHLARQFFHSYGVELNKDYARIAQQINNPKKFDVHGTHQILKERNCIFQKDALKFNYQDYDVIYFFRPMKNELQNRLENRIFSQAKERAIIIPIYAVSQFPHYIRPLETPSKELFMKMTEKVEETSAFVRHLFKKTITPQST